MNTFGTEEFEESMNTVFACLEGLIKEYTSDIDLEMQAFNKLASS